MTELGELWTHENGLWVPRDAIARDDLSGGTFALPQNQPPITFESILNAMRELREALGNDICEAQTSLGRCANAAVVELVHSRGSFKFCKPCGVKLGVLSQ